MISLRTLSGENNHIYTAMEKEKRKPKQKIQIILSHGGASYLFTCDIICSFLPGLMKYTKSASLKLEII